jgi:hypothetical protein
MTAVPSDPLKLAGQLREKAGFTREHTEAAAEALAEAVGGAELVTKADMTAASRDLESRLTIGVGGMLVVVVGIILGHCATFHASLMWAATWRHMPVAQ